ncbi:MAG: hypothetical protein WAL59_29515 [Roseiarcus sp.]
MSALDANDPLAARADLLGELRLAEVKALAAISNDRPKIGGGTNKHWDALSTFDDIEPMSAFDDKNQMSAFDEILLREARRCSAWSMKIQDNGIKDKRISGDRNCRRCTGIFFVLFHRIHPGR